MTFSRQSSGFNNGYLTFQREGKIQFLIQSSQYVLLEGYQLCRPRKGIDRTIQEAGHGSFGYFSERTMDK
jgi:hypothetical protein